MASLTNKERKMGDKSDDFVGLGLKWLFDKRISEDVRFIAKDHSGKVFGYAKHPTITIGSQAWDTEDDKGNECIFRLSFLDDKPFWKNISWRDSLIILQEWRKQYSLENSNTQDNKGEKIMIDTLNMEWAFDERIPKNIWFIAKNESGAVFGHCAKPSQYSAIWSGPVVTRLPFLDEEFFWKNILWDNSLINLDALRKAIKKNNIGKETPIENKDDLESALDQRFDNRSRIMTTQQILDYYDGLTDKEKARAFVTMVSELEMSESLRYSEDKKEIYW